MNITDDDTQFLNFFIRGFYILCTNRGTVSILLRRNQETPVSGKKPLRANIIICLIIFILINISSVSAQTSITSGWEIIDTDFDYVFWEG